MTREAPCSWHVTQERHRSWRRAKRPTDAATDQSKRPSRSESSDLASDSDRRGLTDNRDEARVTRDGRGPAR